MSNNKSGTMIHVFLRLAIVCVLFLASANTAGAKITLPFNFTDNMVLQQKTEVLFHGLASPKKKITIKTSWDNRMYSTYSDNAGNWKMEIITPSAGGPYEISISDGKMITLKNILIGEVWFCSGQSNMEMPLAGWGEIINYEKEITDATYPCIRLFQVKHTTAMKPQDEAVVDFGWTECRPETIGDFSSTAYFFARKLWQELKIPIGLIHSSWGGTPAESWTSYEGGEKVNSYKARLEEGMKEAEKNEQYRPGALYNAMVHPFIEFPIQGVIWYQGEDNVGRATEYVDLFQAMINDWRTKWKSVAMPFYFVQLAPFHKPEVVEPTSQWALLREAQCAALNLKNTGMAVITDIGDSLDIHPKNKQEVGRRLALLALTDTYNKYELAESTAPKYDDYRVEGSKIRVRFKQLGQGLCPEEILKGFIIAGTDHVFYSADAFIEGNDVIVSAPQVTCPAAVRYGWADYPVCNLYGKSGLPVSPFRTDKW